MENTEKEYALLGTYSLAEFAAKLKFVQVNNKLGYSETIKDAKGEYVSGGYPFVTFIDADNKAENVYLSKNLADKVADEGLGIKEVLKDAVISELDYPDGPRFKVGGTKRIELSDLF